MSPFAWHFLCAELPEDWELLRHSLDLTEGSLGFATREGWQARLSWRRYAPRRPPAPGPFRVIWPEPGVLLEWTFEERARGWAEAVAASTRLQAGGTRRITLHGITAEYPAEFRPVRVMALPANVLLAVEGPGRARRVWRRWGIPEAVLQGRTPRDFLRRLLEAEGLRVGEGMWQDGSWVVPISAPGLTPFDRLRFRRAHGEARIWLSDGDRRLNTEELLG